MNLSTLLLGLFCVFLWQGFKTTSFFTSFINENYVLDNPQPTKTYLFPCLTI
jgi:hypothetical protein